MMHSKLVAALLLACPCAAAAASDWCQWRGPDGTGAAPDSNPPAAWSAERNVRWKVAVPGAGHSSPIVHGEHVYLMTAVETEEAVAEPDEPADEPESEGRRGRRGGRGRGRGSSKPTHVHEFVVLALDRKSGAEVWSTVVRSEVPHEGTHPTGSFASGSPVTDGEHVYAFFGSRGVYCLDAAKGAVVWERDLGDMHTRNSFGEGASPALSGDTLVVPWDHEGDSFVAALDKRTGKERWRAARDEPTTWATPVVVEVGGRAQAVLAGTNATVAYDLATGEEVWRCSGLTANVIPTPVVGNGMIYLTSGFRGSSLQAVVLARAKGDVTKGEAIAWSADRGTPYVPSPALSGERLYFLRSNNGIVSCYDAKTGAPHYEGQRLDATNVYASPVVAGGRVYVCGREGEVVVLKDGPEFEVLATNSLGEGIDASPAVAGDELFLRSAHHVYCIAETKGAER